MSLETKRARLVVFDFVGFGFAGASLTWSIFAVALFAPSFGAMFADFGGELPRATALFLTRWFPIALGLLPAAIVGAGVLGRLRPWLRGLGMSIAILLALAQPILFFAVMYLPIFALAEGIQ